MARQKCFLCFVDATFLLRGGTFRFIFWEENHHGSIFILSFSPRRTEHFIHPSSADWGLKKTKPMYLYFSISLFLLILSSVCFVSQVEFI